MRSRVALGLVGCCALLHCEPFEGSSTVADASTPMPTLDGGDSGAPESGPPRGRLRGDDIAALAVGPMASCFTTVKDGSLYCAGRASAGTFMRTLTGADVSCVGTLYNRIVGAPRFEKIPFPGTVTDIALSQRARCAIASKKVWCWGGNDSGELGHPPSTAGDEGCENGGLCNRAPTRIMGVPDDAEFLRVRAGDNHFCALSTAGRVYCWGANENGQLGRPLSEFAAPAPVDLGGDLVSELATGASVTCVALGTAGVKCWGRNAGGAVAPGGELTVATPTLAPLPNLPYSLVAVDVMGGCAFSSRLASATCWSNNQTGLLGIPDARGSRSVPELTAVQSLHVGNSSAVARIGSNAGVRVITWGKSARGGLAKGMVDQEIAAPMAREVLASARLVAYGPEETGLAVVGDRLLAWGANACGQTGHAPGQAGDIVGPAAEPIAPQPMDVPLP